MFLKEASYADHLFDEKYNKNCDIVKYYYIAKFFFFYYGYGKSDMNFNFADFIS